MKNSKEILSRLNSLENTLEAGLQELRTFKAELIEDDPETRKTSLGYREAGRQIAQRAHENRMKKIHNNTKKELLP